MSKIHFYLEKRKKMVTIGLVEWPARVAQAFLPVAKLPQTGMSVLPFLPQFDMQNSGMNYPG
jgi:predicted CoA-binding protein